MSNTSRPRSASRARRIARLWAAVALSLLAAPAAADAALFEWDGAITGVSDPVGVATDAAGRVYVVDGAAHEVVVFDSAREDNRRLASFGGDVLSAPHGITIDNRNRVFVTDAGKNSVYRFTAYIDGNQLREDLGGFAAVRHLDVDRTARLYIADRGTFPQRVEYIDLPRSVGELNVDGFGALDGVARDRGGRLSVSNEDPAGAVRTYHPTAGSREVAGPGSGPGQVSSPRDLDYDPVGRLLVADAGNSRVQAFERWDFGSGFIAGFGTAGSGEGQFGQPTGIAYARGADVYVSDPANDRVVRLRYDDEDDDGAIDALDNCWGLANPGQHNADRDSVGDACDNDDDNDGLVDEADRCPQTLRGPDGNGDGCGDPRSRVRWPSTDRARFRARRPPTRIKGTAGADVVGVDHVDVALARLAGGSCRWYQGSGQFGPPTSCDEPVYHQANGARRWSLPVRFRGRGTYRALSRAVQNGGLAENGRNSRNTRRFRVR